MPMAPAKIARNTKKSNGVSSSVSGGTSTHCAAEMSDVTPRRAKIPAVGRAPLNGAPIQPEASRSAADHREGFCARLTVSTLPGRRASSVDAQTMIMLIDTHDAGWTGHG
jgi:hypothetical protein